MFEAFVTLFSEADWVFYVVYAVALALFIIKMYLPKYWILNIAGIILTIGAITERCVTGENTSRQIIFYIIYSILLLILICAVIRLVRQFIQINKTRKIMAKVKGNNVPLTPEGNPDYSFLNGKVGMVVTDLKPTGKVEIQGSIYEVSSMSDYVPAGSIVKVVKVMVSRVFVEKQ